jgi:hypothetical protein
MQAKNLSDQAFPSIATCCVTNTTTNRKPKSWVFKVVRGCKDDQVWRIGLASKAHNPLKI